jgi:hypothetical protein|eukprot:3927667-Prymnesium_polylepis.1
MPVRKLNEPHYEDYIDTYLPGLFTTAGLECERKWAASSSKCLSFRKPPAQIEEEAAQQPAAEEEPAAEVRPEVAAATEEEEGDTGATA